MKKEINVYLQYPWRISDSQYYKSIIESPPEGINFKNSVNQIGMILNKKKFFFSTLLKTKIRRLIEKTNFPILNVKKVKCSKQFDLIHGAHCLINEKELPWVADFEGYWQFWISGRDTRLGRKKVREILLRKNCKKLIAWTEHAKNNFIKVFPELKEKMEVMHYAVPERKFKKNNSKNIRLLFVSRYFFDKGGLDALESMDILTKKYKNVSGDIISPVPENIKKKYSSNNNIKFHNLIPQGELFKTFFEKADIMIYPGYSDSYGFIFAESLSFGIPVITFDGFARKDLIENGKTGFIVGNSSNPINLFKFNMSIINDMVKKTSSLIENKKLLEKMSRNCREEVKTGKFSIKKRNKRLLEIYEEALK